MIDIAIDLFAWAERRPVEKVVDFETRKKSLPRWHQLRQKPLQYYDRAVARQRGQLPPCPILRFHDLHPVSPGSYGTEPSRRQG
jgi:hypothetical protein